MNLKPNRIHNYVLKNLLSISIGIVFLWFGILKLFPETSPAELLAKRTITVLTFGHIPSSISILLLAMVEVIIGLFLILGLFKKMTLKMAMLHLFFTFSPFLIIPYESFTLPPLIPTLLGQYILKNLVIFAALLTLYKENSKV